MNFHQLSCKGTTMKKIISVCFMLMFVTSTAFAHSGGTDSAGCHAGKKPYHCHGKK